MKYLQLVIYPVNQNLDYDFAISTSLLGWKEILSLSGLVILIVSGILMFKRFRIISFGIFWFLLTLSVESSVIPIRDVIFEHRLYLPLFGCSLIIVFGLFYLLARFKIIYSIGIIILLTLIFGVLGFARNEVWKTNLSLWTDVVKKSPDKARPHLNLGIAYLENRDLQQSQNYFSKTIELDPECWQAYFNRANVRVFLQDYQGAIEDLNIFIKQHPELPDPHNSLGKAKLFAEDFVGAMISFNKAIEIQPDFEESYFNRGNTKMFIQDYPGAIEDYNKTLEINQNNAAAYNNIGQCWVYLKDDEKAFANFSKAIEVDPEYAKAYVNRANTNFRRDKLQEAQLDFTTAIEIDPRYMLAYQGRGLIYLKTGKLQNALEDLQTARILGATISDEFLENIRIRIDEKGR